MNYRKIILLVSFVILLQTISFGTPNESISTFSIVGRDPSTGEIGIAVASRFFGVGTVVPWAKANIGGVATQSYANTSFGWRALELMERGVSPEEIRNVFVEDDEGIARRQFGIVDSKGASVTYTGDSCLDWAGGRSGPNYACQGNILAGEEVVTEMERVFLETDGMLSERLYAALQAGEAAGGDSRGKQSAAIYVVQDKAGYGGYTDQAIDIRVDDHAEPFKELGRLLKIAQLNYAWNIAWTAFTEKRYADALAPMEKCAELDPEYAEVWYDLAVIRLANGDTDGALDALKLTVKLNPKLKASAAVDSDLSNLKENDEFKVITQ